MAVIGTIQRVSMKKVWLFNVAALDDKLSKPFYFNKTYVLAIFLFCVMLAFLLKSVISSHSSCAILPEIPTLGNSKWAIPEKTQTGGLRIYFFENPLQRFIFLLYHSCLSHLNLEMEAECLMKTLSYMNVNISKTKNGRNKLWKVLE